MPDVVPLTFACVRTARHPGERSKYGVEYVERLRNAVRRHMPPGAAYRFVCFTDQPEHVPGVERLPVDAGLPGWWGKLMLFEPTWREGERVIYMDLDTVPVGPLMPLADVGAPWATCENFTRRAGNRTWPCLYGSCVIVINRATDIWARSRALMADADWMSRYAVYGDQRILQECDANATFLQRVLPDGFFVGYRDLPRCHVKPPGASLVIFAGRHKPHNCTVRWVLEEWR